MPTITEYWSPIDILGVDSSVIATRNADNDLRATTFNELRITFMKGLSDSGYTQFYFPATRHSKTATANRPYKWLSKWRGIKKDEIREIP